MFSCLGDNILWMQRNFESEETKSKSFPEDCMALLHRYLTWEGEDRRGGRESARGEGGRRST